MIAERVVAERLKLNDDNVVQINISSNLNYPTLCTVIDELPFQLQARNWKRTLKMNPNEKAVIHYNIKPLTRGEYIFEDLNILFDGRLKLVKKQVVISQKMITKVYPNVLGLHKLQIKAVGNELNEIGTKKIRNLGNSTAFEQIKEYVIGDDYRTINWKATARKTGLMVNMYADEKSQQIYCIINKGRLMKMPFEGMTLLDYAINSAILLSKVALAKQDKAGLLTFSKTVDTILAADKKPRQINSILESLYKIDTHFFESDYEQLYGTIRHKIKNRSLLVLYTNFESMEGLQRDLPALKKMAHHHLLLVIFFENTAIKCLLEMATKNLEDVYIKTIAEKYAFEKKQMLNVLRQNGILCILTTPQNLTIHAINKYLELKNKAWI